jgi:hypothetical protein
MLVRILAEPRSSGEQWRKKQGSVVGTTEPFVRARGDGETGILRRRGRIVRPTLFAM